MFCLSELEDTVRVPPSDLNLPLEVAIKKALQKLFLDKVWSLFFSVLFSRSLILWKWMFFWYYLKVLSIGLCVSIYGIKSIEGGFVLPGDGAATYKVYIYIQITHLFMNDFVFLKAVNTFCSFL